MITLDGERIALSALAAIADGAPAQLGAAGRAAAAAAHEAAVAAARHQSVYGRTTGVGANKDTSVTRAAEGGPDEHALRLLHSHATSGGALRDPARVRATLAIRLNQLAAGRSGASGEVLDALDRLLQSGTIPPVREHGGVGTGDLGALATIALALTGVTWTADDALPFLSSNAASVADAALSGHRLLTLTRSGLVTAATTFVAVDGAIEAFDPAVAALTPYAGVAEACETIRRLVLPVGRAAARLQDPFALRCLPQVHGLALDALADAVSVIEDAASTGAENPVVVLGTPAEGPDSRMLHHGAFNATYLASALDRARLAVAGAATLSTRRLAFLLDPASTGLAPFLGDGTPGASGAMGLEYVAASALGRVRSLAVPAAAQTTVLSRDVEDDASFASLAADQALAMVDDYAVVLACELVAAVRAIRMRGLDLAGKGLGVVVDRLGGSDTAAFADRDLTPDVAAAVALLPDLAG